MDVRSLIIIARVLQYGGGVMLVNVLFFRVLILRPAFSSGVETLPASLLRRLRQIFIVSGIAVLLAGLLLFWATAAQMNDTALIETLSPGTLGAVFFQTRFGAVLQVRAVLALLLLALLPKLYPILLFLRRSWIEAVAGFLALGLLAAIPWTSHAGAENRSLLLLSDSFHLVGVAIWPAGLFPFLLFLSALRRSHLAVPRSHVLATVRLFSEISFVTVFLLALTGTINACFLVGSFTALLGSAYGHWLSLKLSLFAVILGFAAWNRYRLLPLYFAASNESDSAALLQSLRTFVRIELILAAGIIIAVTFLGITPPPHQLQNSP